MTLDEIRAWVKAKRGRTSELARLLGYDADKISKVLGPNPVRCFTADEMDRIRAHIGAETDGLGNVAPIGRAIPIIGQVAAGNWREAVRSPIGSMPLLDPSIPPRAFALQVSGDSMDLYVDDGGNVVVDPDDKALFPDKFYVIQKDGEATFKQFKASPARLVPCSTNPAHGEIAIGAGPFEIIGRVIWRAARM